MTCHKRRAGKAAAWQAVLEAEAARGGQGGKGREEEVTFACPGRARA
jgi:hypothetical protein